MSDPTTPSAPADRPRAASASPHQHLGPARVVAVGRGRCTVELEGDAAARVEVTPAFTFPYEPQVGDELLVLGQGARYYAVGVIAGSRPHTLAFPADATVRAVDGKLTLASDQAVELRAPRVTVRAGVLRTIADRVVEKASELRRWVRGLMAVRAGESRRVVDGLDSTRCENSSTVAKDTVKIDGDQLHLGH